MIPALARVLIALVTEVCNNFITLKTAEICPSWQSQTPVQALVATVPRKYCNVYDGAADLVQTLQRLCPTLCIEEVNIYLRNTLDKPLRLVEPRVLVTLGY